MLVDLLLLVWPVTLGVGLLYLASRGPRRDPLLHLGLFAGVGLTAGAAASVGLWVVFGGWGPAAPEFWGSLGLLVGTTWGMVSFRRLAQPAAAADAPQTARG